jgi:hypothetical protein
MLRLAAMTIFLVTLFSSPAGTASPWTEGQAEWLKHGARHGRWDCYGKCPEGRAHRDRQRHYFRQR